MDDQRQAWREDIAAALLEIGAVTFSPNEPFRWASGLRAPLYCDNRLIMGYPQVRRTVAQGFAMLLKELKIDPELIVGTATAGIPHAAWLADELAAPMAYVRSRPKGHGRGRRVEGHVCRGQRTVVVEDLVSTGGSSLRAVEAVEEEGLEVEAVLAIFAYGLPDMVDAFRSAEVALHTLTTFDQLLETARERGQLPAEALLILRQWQKDPAAWSKAHPVAP